ncbi:hypothetical protein BGZ57DRAFT_880155 [Hyaloscypha finlandica]|nr:hypothetical protein BGZ57DRAFT_880155 [Hyaloscypha finlandica]
MTSPTQLRNVIITTRVLAAILSTISIAFFIIVLTYIIGWSGSNYTGLSVLPTVALGISIFWNVVALVNINTIAHTFHAIIDLVVLSLILALGLVGFLHDEYNYLRNGYHLSVNSIWLSQELAAGGCMVASAVLQLSLVILNLLSARRSKRIQEQELVVPPLPPPYGEPIITKLPTAELRKEREEWFEDCDGKSLISTSTLADSEKSLRTTEA